MLEPPIIVILYVISQYRLPRYNKWYIFPSILIDLIVYIISQYSYTANIPSIFPIVDGFS